MTTGTTPRRIQYHEYGGPEVMRLETFTPTQPGADQILVRVRAAAANKLDWGIRSGRLRSMTGKKFPRALGTDFAGVVEAAGPGVTTFRVGDEVLGGAPLKSSGAFGDLVVTDLKTVVRKPADLSFEEAAAIVTPGLTAFQAIVRKGRLKPGGAVFVTGCLGGVGRSASMIALARGATVAGSCRATSAEKARALGIDPVVGFDFDPASLRGRYDIVLDAANALSVEAMRTMLKPGGQVVDIHPAPAKFVRSMLPGPYNVVIAKPVRQDMEEVVAIAADGKLRLPIARTVPLEQAIPALTELEQHGTPKGGKLVISLL
ncbi:MULTISPECIES: NADP-dependent oxidoreductase [unclassified Streptomyces]|uniref:NADP-dependent oxidoreductase n=1 Tax=unclassified Streptomyces TaxID=2593676 RepID=UPI00056D4FD8|nr:MULTISPECIES: NADP-dependent oxidoreductase [unclassified Streptomyces]MYX39387.1 zinc-binding dehydrogenase [Streptomyces sp. SID8377]